MGCCVSSGTADWTNETTFRSTSNVQNSAINDPVKTKIREAEEEKLKMAPDSSMSRPDSIDPEEGSEASEICSLSLSESVSSTAVKNGYGEEEVKQRKSQKSPAKSRTHIMGNNYPTRRTDQSPRKRNTGTCNTGAKVGSSMRDPAERGLRDLEEGRDRY